MNSSVAAPSNPSCYCRWIKKDLRAESLKLTLCVTFCRKIVIVNYNIFKDNISHNMRQLIVPSPHEPIQDKEKDHPEKIGPQVCERTDPVRHNPLDQLE